jgi:hypothetical protein
MFTTRVVPTCSGKALIISGRPDSDRPELAVMTQLAESEAREQAMISAVTFDLADAGDFMWLEPTLQRLAELGRSVTLRSARILPKRLVARAAESHCRIELLVAHQRIEIQRALLRPNADSVGDLLRHAQHLLAVGLTVTVRVAPIVAGLHDTPGGIVPLFKAIAAANLREVSVRVGALTQPVVSALARALDLGTQIFWARAYGRSVSDVHGDSPTRGAIWNLRSQSARALEAGLARLAQDEGLRVNACGCAHFCHLEGESFGATHPSPLLRSLFDSIQCDTSPELESGASTPLASPTGNNAKKPAASLGRADALVVDAIGNSQRIRARHRRAEDHQGSQNEQVQDRAGHQLVLLN